MENDIIEYNDENDNDAYYSDHDTYPIHSDAEDERQNDTNPYAVPKIRPSIRWTLIKIGSTILDVSTIGTIRPYRSSNIPTEGTILEGTPYRYYRVEEGPNKYNCYFVHEIVWQAFNGTPSDEYRIAHKPEYTTSYRKVYSNRLHNITLLKNKHIERFKLNKCKGV